MTLLSFNAEQSLYRSSRHYRSSALASAVGGIRPSYDGLPPGSYQQSCFDCSYNFFNGCLNCYCMDGCGCGGFKYASLSPTSACQGDIYNHYGFLDCDSGQSNTFGC